VLKVLAGDGKTVGPILLGAAKPAHVMTPSSSVRRISYMTALDVAQGRHA
jgi:malate dehydrogenase (oxaloacetate-decarboxylating)(NADP+)